MALSDSTIIEIILKNIFRNKITFHFGVRLAGPNSYKIGYWFEEVTLWMSLQCEFLIFYSLSGSKILIDMCC